MLDDDEFVGCAVLDRTGTPLGRIEAISAGERPRARVQGREFPIDDAVYDSGQRTFRLRYDAEAIPR
jgi:hypothetical protein